MTKSDTKTLTRTLWRSFVAAIALSAAALVAPVAEWSPAPAPAFAAMEGKPLDRLILKSGKIIEGEILEETESTIRIRVVVAGISAPTTYQKSEILEIKRAGAATEADAKPATEEDKPAPAATAATRSTPSTSLRTGKTDPKKPEVDSGTPQLYVVELKGSFGVDISETPLRQLFEDVDRVFKDLVPGVGAEAGRMVVDPAVRQNHIVVMKVNMVAPSGFNTIFRAEELAPIVMSQIVEKGRRIVFWVEHASGGAAFLPWVSPEMYFSPEGLLGGIAELDEFSSGDHMVDEKLIGAFLGAAEGFAIKGGYTEHLPVLRAMIRKQNWLCVRFEGGRPQYFTSQPTDGDGWQILSDSGEGDFKDKSALGGNDIFSLDADWAMKLGIAKGIVDSVDDLAFALGIHRDYVELTDTRGTRIFDDWKSRIESTTDLILAQEQPGRPLGRLWREFNGIQVTGDYPERRRQRGRKLALLRQIRGLVAQYAEVFDTDETWRAQLDVMISRLQLEAEQDARANR